MSTQEKEVSKVIKQFDRFAHQYDTYNIIQADVARTLVDKLPAHNQSTILDFGCGRGEVFKNIKKKTIDFDRFVAIDSSSQMLGLHPSYPYVEKIIADFNHLDTYNNLSKFSNITLLLSSSALQWSKDLDFVFRELSKKSTKAYFAIFTANTFKTLHKVAHVDSPIYMPETLKRYIEKYYEANFELKEYRLEFASVKDMFHYIKKSGVSGGERQLSYKQIKALMYQYPLNYLEFEVLFVEATSLA